MNDPYLQREAKRSVIYTGLTLSFAGLYGLYLIYFVGHPAWYYVIVGALGLFCVFVEILFKKLHARISTILFFILIQVVGASILFNQMFLAKKHLPFTGFGGLRAMLMAIAMLAPSSTIGIVLITFFSLGGVILYYSWPQEVQNLLLPIEPWLTVLIGVMCLFVLRARRRLVQVSRYTEQAISEKHWLERVAYFMLTARDLTNSPLQTLKTAAALVRKMHPDHLVTIQKIDNDVQLYTRLNQIIDPLDLYINWEKNVTSFNALDEIQKEIAASVQIRKSIFIPSYPEEVLLELKQGGIRKESYEAAVWFSLICISSGFLGLFQAHSPLSSGYLWYPQAGLGCLFLVILLKWPKLSYWVTLGIVSILSCSILLGSYLAFTEFGLRGGIIPAFDTLKLLMAVLFFVAPTFWVGGGFIFLASVEPVFQVLSWPPEWKARLALQEPGSTAFIGLLVLIALYLRRQQITQLRNDARYLTEQAWLDRFVGITCSVRQLMEVLQRQLHRDIKVLRGCLSDAETLTLVPNIQQALDKLDGLSHALRELDPLIHATLENIHAEPDEILDEVERQIKIFESAIQFLDRSTIEAAS